MIVKEKLKYKSKREKNDLLFYNNQFTSYTHPKLQYLSKILSIYRYRL